MIPGAMRSNRRNLAVRVNHVPAIAMLCAIVTVVACWESKPPLVTSTSRAPLTFISQNMNITYDTSLQMLRNGRIHTNAETSVAVVVKADYSRNVVVAMNGASSMDPQPGLTWAVIENGGSTLVGPRDANDPTAAWKWPTPSGFSGHGGFLRYDSDPTVVAPGGAAFNPAIVAYAGIFKAADYTAHIAVATSTDGGETFTHSTWISTGASDGCLDDQPWAAADPTSGDVWVWWRKVCSLTNQTSWLCQTNIDSSGNITAQQPIDISASITEKGAGFPPGMRGQIVRTGFSGAVSVGIIPRMGDIAQTIYLAFPDKYVAPNGYDCAFSPPPTSDSVTWRLAWSQTPAGGQDAWFTNTLTTDAACPYCVTNKADGQNRARSEIVYVPGEAVMLTTVPRSVTSNESGAVGLRALLFQRTIRAPTDADGCQTIWMPTCSGAAVVQITDPDHVPIVDTTCSQFFPAPNVSIDPLTGFNQAVWTWHDTRWDNITPLDQLRGASLRAGYSAGCVPNTVNTNTQGSIASGTGVPTPVPPISPHNTAWGDYEGLGADPVTGQLWSAWADYRTGRVEVWPCQMGMCSYSLSDVNVASFYP